jgi:hypothetical protein
MGGDLCYTQQRSRDQLTSRLTSLREIVPPFGTIAVVIILVHTVSRL